MLAQLKVGAPAPGIFDAGTYELCQTAACTAVPDVQVWTRNAGQLDAQAIFGVVSKTRDMFLFNRESLVSFSGFSFRNPPQYNKVGVNTRETDAAYETDAIIESLFYHDNMAVRDATFSSATQAARCANGRAAPRSPSSPRPSPSASRPPTPRRATPRPSPPPSPPASTPARRTRRSTAT